MPTYEVTIRRFPAEQTLKVRADNPALAAQELLKSNHRFKVDWDIVDVDGLAVIDRCEGCGVHLFEGDGYSCDTDGVYLCPRCMDSLEKQEPADAE